MAILVAGGAGYIGSHMVKDLIEHGYDVVVAYTFCNDGNLFVEGFALCLEEGNPQSYEKAHHRRHGVKVVGNYSRADEEHQEHQNRQQGKAAWLNTRFFHFVLPVIHRNLS